MPCGSSSHSTNSNLNITEHKLSESQFEIIQFNPLIQQMMQYRSREVKWLPQYHVLCTEVMYDYGTANIFPSTWKNSPGLQILIKQLLQSPILYSKKFLYVLLVCPLELFKALWNNYLRYFILLTVKSHLKK